MLRMLEEVLASTIRKFFFCSWLMCPIPARRSPVTESCIERLLAMGTLRRQWQRENSCLWRAERRTSFYGCAAARQDGRGGGVVAQFRQEGEFAPSAGIVWKFPAHQQKTCSRDVFRVSCPYRQSLLKKYFRVCVFVGLIQFECRGYPQSLGINLPSWPVLLSTMSRNGGQHILLAIMPSQFSPCSGLTISSYNWYSTFSRPAFAYFFQLPQDPTKPPVIFHLFPWVGSMVTYGMEPYKFFMNARAKVCLSFLAKSKQ